MPQATVKANAAHHETKGFKHQVGGLGADHTGCAQVTNLLGKAELIRLATLRLAWSLRFSPVELEVGGSVEEVFAQN